MSKREVFDMICEACRGSGETCSVCEECDVSGVCGSISTSRSGSSYTDNDLDLFFHRLTAFRDELSFFLSKLDS